MSAANPSSMEKSMVSLLVVANAGGGSPLPCGWSFLLIPVPCLHMFAEEDNVVLYPFVVLKLF
jgi:hypothetical protein